MFVDNDAVYDAVYTNTGLRPKGEGQRRKQENSNYKGSHWNEILSLPGGCCNIAITLIIDPARWGFARYRLDYNKNEAPWSHMACIMGVFSEVSKSMRPACVLVIFLFVLCLGTAQETTTYIGHYLEPFPGPQVYKDPNSGTLFYVETDGRHVAAI